MNVNAETLNIGRVLVEAATFNFFPELERRTMDLGEISEHVDEFFDLLEECNIDYVLVGGVALLRHIPGRNTMDLDLIVSLEEIESVKGVVISDANKDFAMARYKTLRIDILRNNNRFFAEVKEKHSETLDFDGRDICCATPRGLILMKLVALPSLYRQLDFDRTNIYESDIARLMHRYPEAAEGVVEEVAKHVGDDDLKELEKLVTETKAKISRFSR